MSDETAGAKLADQWVRENPGALCFVEGRPEIRFPEEEPMSDVSEREMPRIWWSPSIAAQHPGWLMAGIRYRYVTGEGYVKPENLPEDAVELTVAAGDGAADDKLRIVKLERSLTDALLLAEDGRELLARKYRGTLDRKRARLHDQVRELGLDLWWADK